ncbi:MAG: TraX family protein [Ruminococcus sp.]|nr:TraX family protein [Ruminococcus sp.]
MNQSTYRYRCLSGSTLKIIAIIAMAIDHFAASILYHGILLPNAPISQGTTMWTIYQIYQVMRFIGRIAFPIFCFLLVEGFLHTSNRKKYAFRLFLFALLSEFPFDFALQNTFVTWEYQNVYFTLCIGLLTIWLLDYVQESSYRIPLQMLSIFAGCVLAYLLQTDYDYKGIILIVVLYYFHNNRSMMTLVGCLSLFWEAPACFAFIPINMYNGKRGLSLKYFFYLFYPLHLLIYGLVLHFVF